LAEEFTWGIVMALVKVCERGAITLPRELQEALRVQEGDVLDAVAVEGGVLLKPVSAADRDAAWESIERARSSVRYVGPGPEPSDDELMEEVVQVVKEVRKEMARERARRR
jgi:bifunctional DNA-binding transcriptional regulator/antitoxin component of YhaV-PrlF toxin-antitoxin module